MRQTPEMSEIGLGHKRCVIYLRQFICLIEGKRDQIPNLLEYQRDAASDGCIKSPAVRN